MLTVFRAYVWVQRAFDSVSENITSEILHKLFMFLGFFI